MITTPQDYYSKLYRICIKSQFLQRGAFVLPESRDCIGVFSGKEASPMNIDSTFFLKETDHVLIRFL